MKFLSLCLCKNKLPMENKAAFFSVVIFVALLYFYYLVLAYVMNIHTIGEVAAERAQMIEWKIFWIGHINEAQRVKNIETDTIYAVA